MPVTERLTATATATAMNMEQQEKKRKRPLDDDNENGEKENGNTQVKKKSKKSKKPSSPFRIKVGCVVALRYRSDGNNDIAIVEEEDKTTANEQQQARGEHGDGNSINDANNNTMQQHQQQPLFSYSEIWADPVPGRDEGLALIGRRVRCAFPKMILSDTFRHKSTTRYLEGEVVSIPDYEIQWEKQRLRRRKRQAIGMKVDLLVDRDRLDALPFLKRSDYDAVDVDLSKLSESSKRSHVNEQRIKGGKNKVSVQVVLGDYMIKDMQYGSNDKNNKTLEARWVIRKRVPVLRKRQPVKKPRQQESQSPLPLTADDTNNDKKSGRTPDNNQDFDKLENKEGDIDSTADSNKNEQPPKNGASTTTSAKKVPKSSSQPSSSSKRRKVEPPKDCFIGDGNDSKMQQQQNWRWQASRFDDNQLDLSDISFNNNNTDALTNFIGEVVTIQPSATTGSSTSTLATVAVKRLFLPEHTRVGRLSHHKSCEVFDWSCDEENQNSENENFIIKSTKTLLFRIPIEQLVIVSRSFNRVLPNNSNSIPDTKLEPTKTKNNNLSLEATKSYSIQRNMFISFAKSDRMKNNGENGENGDDGESGELEIDNVDDETNLQDDRQKKFCRGVQKVTNKPNILSTEIEKIPSQNEAAFPLARGIVRAMNSFDFSLPAAVRRDPIIPSLKPVTKKQTKKMKSPKGKKSSSSVADMTEKLFEKVGSLHSKYGHNVKVPTRPPKKCSRTIVYNKERKKKNGGASSSRGGIGEHRDRVRNRRLVAASGPIATTEKSDNKDDDKALQSRKARANQRRLLRDVSVLGVGLDTMAGREQMLRFDRSKVHGWGVYADEDIREGEMVIEYRGEIVGNAVSEKREMEYDKAKLGSDYMFRIDTTTVCDATKQGNVARFINASCDPNCSAKIITIEGSKRIAVYAKRDIAAGEELYYDYKFPLEYEQSKRIPCMCKSPDCQGFLNWDKRYIVSPEKVANPLGKSNAASGATG